MTSLISPPSPPSSWTPPFPLPPELHSWLSSLLNPELAAAKRLPAGLLLSAPGNHGQVPLALSLTRALLDGRTPDPALESDLVLLRPESEPPLHHRPVPPPGGASPAWGVDPIREGLDQLVLAPLRARRRLFVLEGAEHLTPAAGNALLKTVEEQGRTQTALFLFTTQDAERVLPPLRARFVPVELPPLSRPALEALLQAQRNSPSWDDALSRGAGCLDRTAWYLSPAGAAWGRNLRSFASALIWGDSWPDLTHLPRAWEALASSFRSGVQAGGKASAEDVEADAGRLGLKWLNLSSVSPVMWVREVGRLLDRHLAAWDLLNLGPAPVRWSALKEDLVRLYARLVLRWSLTWEAQLFSLMGRWVRLPAAVPPDRTLRTRVSDLALSPEPLPLTLDLTSDAPEPRS